MNARRASPPPSPTRPDPPFLGDPGSADEASPLAVTPTVLLDADGRVLGLNDAFADLVGTSVDAAVHEPFARVCGSPDPVALDALLARALTGPITSARVAARVIAGAATAPRDLLLTVELQPMRVGAVAGTILAVTSWCRDDEGTMPCLGDVTYAISLRPFGVLRWVRRPDDGATSDLVGKLCFRALFQREEPCAHCPLRAPSRVDRTAGFIAGGPASDGQPYMVMASHLDSTTALVSAAVVNRSQVRGLVRMETDRRADEAGLTGREREVLDLLLKGRSAPDIADALRIAVSTAKFHQSNVLRKLGVGSRGDLYSRLL
ncbi:MAG: PAS domain-containing protein [Polyangiaceae bacterium]|nr:PAS domain-containing protein [Polyangiaceae bacterium]